MYEFHVTVSTNNVEKFKTDCGEIGVKPIVIDTITADNQVMTSSVSKDKSDIHKVVNSLCEYGYTTLRIKIEKKPEERQDSDFIYYETHFRLRLPLGYDVTKLDQICNSFGLHRSKNLFKKSETCKFLMLTYRTTEMTLQEFNEYIDTVKFGLILSGLIYDKVEIEECIYDSNTSLDIQWMNAEVQGVV